MSLLIPLWACFPSAAHIGEVMSPAETSHLSRLEGEEGAHQLVALAFLRGRPPSRRIQLWRRGGLVQGLRWMRGFGEFFFVRAVWTDAVSSALVLGTFISFMQMNSQAVVKGRVPSKSSGPKVVGSAAHGKKALLLLGRTPLGRASALDLVQSPSAPVRMKFPQLSSSRGPSAVAAGKVAAPCHGTVPPGLVPALSFAVYGACKGAHGKIWST